MTKITTLQGETVFQTLELPNDFDAYSLTSEDVAKIRTSMTEQKIIESEKEEAEKKNILESGKIWLGIVASIAALAVLLSGEKEQ